MIQAVAEHMQYPFFQRVLLACVLVGTVCGVLSVYVVLRQLIFMGLAVTQLASVGLGVAALTGAPPLPSAVVAAFVGVVPLGLAGPRGSRRAENFVALLYMGAWAVSIILFALAERGNDEMTAILYGDILGVLMPDIYAFLPIFAVVILIHALLYKEILFSSFDPETATTQRINVKLYDMVLYLTIAAVVSFAVKMLGLLLVFSFLAAPGTVALLFAKRMRGAIGVAIAAALLMTIVGTAAASAYDLPPGPVVAAAGIAVLALAWPASRLWHSLDPEYQSELSLRTRRIGRAALVGSLALAVALFLLAVGLRAVALAQTSSAGAGQAALEQEAPAAEAQQLPDIGELLQATPGSPSPGPGQ